MRARANKSRAFTLIEVLVALSAGVLVSMAAFTLSKNATTFFQHEARISSAQLALTLAMNRLTNDIQRAAYMSTENIQADPRVCRDTLSTWPIGLQSLAGVQISASPMPTPQSAANGLFPDRVIIGGSMDSTESFHVQSIIPGNAGAPLLILRDPTLEPATMRMTAQLGPGETLATKLDQIFYPNGQNNSGRFAHIYHPESNWHWYGVIANYSIVNNVVQVQLAGTPTIPLKPSSQCGIGLGDVGSGWMLSVVTRVQYDIRSLAAIAGNPSNPYGAVVAPVSPMVTGDSGRTELVRVELDTNGNEIGNTMEVVAEYAVDMRFGLTVASQVLNNNYNPSVTSYPLGHPTVYTTAKDIVAGGTPQRIRSVQVRLATRTRAPDRDTDLPVGPEGQRLHFLVDPNIQPPYARVRMSYANVALPNQGGFSLW